MLFFWRLALTVTKSAIRVIVSLKVILAMCGSLASTESDSENNDDAFVGLGFLSDWPLIAVVRLAAYRQLVRPNR